MHGAAFPELRGRPRPPRHRRRPGKTDRVLLWLKAATILAATGLLGVVVLLAMSGEDPNTARRSPTVPTIVPGGSGDDRGRPAPTSATPTMDPPALLTETAEIAVSPPPPPPPTTISQPRPTSPPPRPPEFPFAVIGERCSPPGAFSITREHDPVVCMRRRGDGTRWAPAF